LKLFLLSGLLHFLIGVRLLPALPLAAAIALGLLLALSAVLVPMGLMARRLARPPRSDQLAAGGLFFLGLFSSLFVLTLLRELVLLVGWMAGAQWQAVSAAVVPVLSVALSLITDCP